MIGIFDSGYGGLTVLKPLIDKFKEYDFIYFGDNARAPYGSRSQEEIFQYTKQAVDWLFRERCELVILACNTASSQALRKIQQEYLPKNWPDKKVLGVLIPVAEAVAKLDGRIGILATKATVESGAYLREINKLVEHSMFNILQVPAPKLVPMIESGKIDQRVIQEYTEKLKNIKNVVLGCTHYSLIKNIMQSKMPEVRIFDSPSIVPASLENYLLRHPEIEKKITRGGKRLYVTTKDPEKFSKFARDFLDFEISAEKVIL